MCMYTYIHIYIYIYVHIFVHICVCIHVYMYIYVCVCIYICIYIYTYIHTYIHTYTHTYVRTYLYVSVCLYLCLCVDYACEMESVLLMEWVGIRLHVSDFLTYERVVLMLIGRFAGAVSQGRKGKVLQHQDASGDRRQASSALLY